MAFIVLALGALMAIAGGYEIYFGNTYISVERGWSAFISGTVLLTGGLVTIALGLAIHSLTRLRMAFLGAAGQRIAPFGELGIPSIPAEPDLVAGTYDAVPEEHPAEAPPADALAAEPVLSPPAAHVAEEQTPASFDQPDPSVTAPGVESAPELRPSVFDNVPLSRPAFGPRQDQLTSKAVTAPPLSDWRRERPLSPRDATRSEALQDVRSEASSPAVDDWLDRSFADLERDMVATQGRSHHGREPIQGSGTEPPRPTVHSEVVPADATRQAVPGGPESPQDEEQIAVPQPLPSHETATSSPAPTASAVIGRYESDGTSYVMYADGSIEAQSEAGVYRFASMTELKSFLET